MLIYAGAQHTMLLQLTNTSISEWPKSQANGTSEHWFLSLYLTYVAPICHRYVIQEMDILNRYTQPMGEEIIEIL